MQGLRRFINDSPRLKSASQRVLSVSSGFGLDPIVFGRAVRGLARFPFDLATFRTLSRTAGIQTRIESFHPILGDRFASAGVASGHYFHQDLWAARRIFAIRPDRHVDVGSRIDGFVAHLLVFMPVAVVDVRPLATDVRGLTFVQAEGSSLETLGDESVRSVSSLHAVEHFGLGRYGDPLDPRAPVRAMAALARVLAPGGRLYFSVPVGVERVEFNAHRVFAVQTILRVFADLGLRLVEFSAVDDRGSLIAPADPASFGNARFSCGLFEFSK